MRNQRKEEMVRGREVRTDGERRTGGGKDVEKET